MGCIISSKPSTHQQVIIPNHHLLTHVPPPSNTNHTIHELTPPKHDHQHTLTIHTNNNNNLKVDNALERYSSFHTVEEYDELLQRITNHNDVELTGVVPVPVPVSDTTDSACENETRDNKKQDMEFQTVASLRQWLNAPGGGSHGDADAATMDYTALKASFSFCESNSKIMMWGPEENSVMVKTGAQEEEESIVELVAAFDKYMQQLQIDEDNILKQIHNMNAV
ncbi:hypothetical protein HanPI659440_Chr03g0124261 [Helianthus annuus]|nr:hypothetical protein HanPI659440_Chr03g0124261 [Helianthus annuus]